MPDDITAQKAMVLASRAELRNRDLLIEKLKHQLAGMRRQRFGATSEALDKLELGIEDEEIARAAQAVPEPTPGTKRQPKRRPIPGHSTWTSRTGSPLTHKLVRHHLFQPHCTLTTRLPY